MAIESFDEVKAYLESQKDTGEVKTYLQGMAQPTLDGVKSFLETDENGKKYLQSFSDTRVTQGIETFKANNLAKLVEEEMKKLNPQLDTKDLKIQELQNKFDALEKEKVRESNLNKGLKMAAEKKLPADLIPYFLGQDEQSTISNLSNLEKSLQEYTKSVRESILNDGSYTPPSGGSGSTLKNPWAKETLNLTEQGKLIKENPTLASQFMAQAKK